VNKLIYILSCMLILTVIPGCSNNQTYKSQNKVVEYGDFKCPYCKKVDEHIMPELKKDYIDKGKVDYQFVNVVFLGNNSIKGSRAGHAVENISPKQYLTFQKLMFSKQSHNENEWITEKLIDQQIDKLDISNKKAKQIKIEYKTKDSRSWKDAKKDINRYKKISEVPTVYVNGKKLKNPYSYKEYKKHLK